MEIAKPTQGDCDGGESDRRGAGVGEPAVTADEKTGSAECDKWGLIDVESVEEQCDVVAAAIGAVAHRALRKIRERLAWADDYLAKNVCRTKQRKSIQNRTLGWGLNGAILETYW